MKTLHGRYERGSALLTVMILASIVLSITAGVLYYTGQERRRAINASRAIPRNYCAETGLQIARAYFGSDTNWPNRDSFLSSPTNYNPVPSTSNSSPANPIRPAGSGGPLPSYTAKPELYADLDGDGKQDVFIYIRDDMDELPPAISQNWGKDNNEQVIIGAMCISSTLVPRLEDGKLDTANLTAESLLSYNGMKSKIAQNCSGTVGGCNANNQSP